jgi:hypothetical protein
VSVVPSSRFSNDLVAKDRLSSKTNDDRDSLPYVVNILHNRGVAFVTYANELQAQFAREAMANQSMDGDEILNVR